MVGKILKVLLGCVFLIFGILTVNFLILGKQVIGEELILKKIILTSAGLAIVLFFLFMKRAEKQFLLILSVFVLFAPSITFVGLKYLDSLITYSKEKFYQCKINDIRIISGRFTSTQVQIKDCIPKWPSDDTWVRMNIFNEGTWINDVSGSGLNLNVVITTQPGITGFEAIKRVDLAIEKN